MDYATSEKLLCWLSGESGMDEHATRAADFAVDLGEVRSTSELDAATFRRVAKRLGRHGVAGADKLQAAGELVADVHRHLRAAQAAAKKAARLAAEGEREAERYLESVE